MIIRGSVSRSILPCLLPTVATILLGTGTASARDLTFEERVAAQEVIERVYYSHQIGATRPFDEAVPRTLIEAKVRRTLMQSAALEQFCGAPITAEALSSELQRIVRGTRMPDRLRALFEALGNDTVLIQETLVRASLAGRLAGGLFEQERATLDPDSTGFDAWWERATGPFREADTPTVARLMDENALQIDGVATTPVDGTWDNGILGNSPLDRSDFASVWTGREMLVWGGTLSGVAGGAAVNSGERYDPLTDTWRLISTSGAPSARSNPTAVWTGREMIIWGGGFNTGGRYDPDTDTWRPISALNAPLARTSTPGVWTGTEMIIWGSTYGFCTLRSPCPPGDGGRYNPETDTWRSTSLLGAPNAALRGYDLVWTGREVLVVGGAYQTWLAQAGGDDPPPFIHYTYLPGAAAYDPVADTWRPAAGGTPPLRQEFSAVWTGEALILWGGHRYVTECTSLEPAICTFAHEMNNSGWRYDPSTNLWTEISTAGAPTARYFDPHQAAWTGTEMVVLGGIGVLSTEPFGGRYDPAADAWSTVATPASMAAFDVEAVHWTGSQVLAWGGIGRAKGGKYDPALDAWTPIGLQTPQTRSGHVALWTGREMIIWGADYFRSGGRYDPVLDAWFPTSTVGAALTGSSDVTTTAVWSGQEMIVWSSREGGRYDPVADSWHPISLPGDLYVQNGQSAVWSGTEMIVWGGFGWLCPPGGSCIPLHGNEGNAYDPRTDTWRRISTSGAPPGRTGHVAVFGGGRMLVWGGRNAVGTSVGSGGAYDPSTDTWTPITDTAAPVARDTHTAVWTGAEMIVWGGAFHDCSRFPCTTTFLGSGGRYNPASGRWTPMTGVSAPAARSSHTAVWADGRMLVWGGTTGPAFTDRFDATGGRYDPESDTWEPVSSVNAPAGRSGHTAVWTGRHMIVWGGLLHFSSGQDGSRGGRYVVSLARDLDGDGYDSSADCDDTNPAIHPGALEVCNGVDDNCNGQVDEGLGPGEVGVSLDPTLLWPPNHRMVDIRAAVALSGGCPAACPTPAAVVLLSVTSNEADDADGSGDGNTASDIQDAVAGSADFDLKLRAERDSSGEGRLYQVNYLASDCFGETAVGVAGVLVPHDQGSGTEPVLVSTEDSAAGTVLRWDSVPGAFSYKVIRGMVGSLREAGDFIDLGTVACIQPSSAATSTQGEEDAEVPSLGEAYFYLVAYNDGQDSGYGSDTATKPRLKTGGGCE